MSAVPGGKVKEVDVRNEKKGRQTAGCSSRISRFVGKRDNEPALEGLFLRGDLMEGFWMISYHEEYWSEQLPLLSSQNFDDFEEG